VRANAKLTEGISFEPIHALIEVSGKIGVQCRVREGKGTQGTIAAEALGLVVSSSTQKVKSPGSEKPETNIEINCRLTPDLFHINSVLLDDWHAVVELLNRFRMHISLKPQFSYERERHKLTAKMYKSEITICDNQEFSFRDLKFSIGGSNNSSYVSLSNLQQLKTDSISILVSRLFELGVFWEREEILSY
jgi:hypothetical protein